MVRVACQGPAVFVFNPLAEGYIGRGKGFAPTRHQVMLTEDLANLPQFLCDPGDIVLLGNRPSPQFLQRVEQAGFALPEFVEIKDGRIAPRESMAHQKYGGFRPWAWSPESVRLLEPLFDSVSGEARSANQYFNDGIARLYSKAWSAAFLRKILDRYRAREAVGPGGLSAQSRSRSAGIERWLCSAQEAGVAVNTVDEALEAIAQIRSRGHHRVVAKQAYGSAGRNSLRLWEPAVLPAQRRWLAHATETGQPLVIEPWLERELDFSIQLEMGPGGLQLCGYTGLINDRKGQFLANWAEADYSRYFPTKTMALLGPHQDISAQIQELYAQILSLLEAELETAGLAGPVSIDALIYRTGEGCCKLKPVVEINPRYTMGRVTVELMKHTWPGCTGIFRLVSQSQARAEGFDNLSSYARVLADRMPLRVEGDPFPRLRQGALCLNDPDRAQVCLAVFEVSFAAPKRGNPRP